MAQELYSDGSFTSQRGSLNVPSSVGSSYWARITAQHLSLHQAMSLLETWELNANQGLHLQRH